jgi:hypothetical protein
MGINNQTVMTPISSFPDGASAELMHRGRTGHLSVGGPNGGCQGFRGPAPSTLLDEYGVVFKRMCLRVYVPPGAMSTGNAGTSVKKWSREALPSLFFQEGASAQLACPSP